ncbi:MAG: PEP-CTERM sorting domain-containing protein [Armatimonadetes bacterium]|nr:PEP-CTERM sorting domain-containing protein [Armatimonadota bacterium]
MQSNRLLAASLVASLTCAASLSNAAFMTLNSPTVGPNQPGTFYVTGTITVGAGETVLSPNVVSTVALPFLPAFTAGFNYNCGNFDNDILSWNGTTNYTGKILDFTVNPNNLGYSGGMPLGVYNFNPFFPNQQPGISLDFVDANGAEHSMQASYHITVTNTTPEPASIAALAIGALAIRRRKKA